jgi:hypothetical protein
MTCVTKTEFERELEVFRTEEETAQQYFFCYLSVRSLAAKKPDVLAAMNEASLFWATTHHAMLLSAIVALGRIFDQSSRHNINTLMLRHRATSLSSRNRRWQPERKALA